MKIAMIMGRGIEGCGVTKFTLEQAKWFADNGYDYTIYASKDKSWTRKNSHEVSNIVQLKLAKAEETDKMIAGANAADVVILNSLPSVGHPEKAIEQFKRFLENVNKPIVLIQHDHASMSIRRNAALEEAVKVSKVIFAHSKTNDFSKIVNEITESGGLSSFFGDDSEPKQILNFQPGMNFESVRSKYWKDIEEQNSIHHKWIGRTTSWKGYVQMFKFHNEYLRKNGQITTFEGIEKSPAYLGFRELSEFHPMIDKNINDINLELDQPAYVFGPFVNEEMLERMSLCGFGYQLSLLDARFIERSIEYTHCEVVCTGTIPVFRKAYGERCTHRKFGDKLIECKDNGTIWLDDNDMQPAFDLVNKLSKDLVMRNEWREQAFEFYKSHQDSQFTFEEMMTKIKEAV